MSTRQLISQCVKWTRLAAITASCGYISWNFIAEPILCSGSSMEPTLHDNDIILTERFSSVFTKNYNRGDVVVARCPTNPNTLICKRVVAVAGDSIRQGFFSQIVIPRGHVWLAGDNTNHSTDSRVWGPIPIGLIVGKAVLKVWPFEEFEVVPNTPKVRQKSPKQES
ncbi:mitochondrial inner membrane protease subunit 1-like [Oppia nitens]|uniref:mitochondrial inner membrane protease subunit 1-like n=1 Tax=Oppia nitens TaxID=1686743 RepID=UPI0023DAA35A|nr:mitochondrial inner membrane protease subunit 1-like [Oppia nitens]